MAQTQPKPEEASQQRISPDVKRQPASFPHEPSQQTASAQQVQPKGGRIRNERPALAPNIVLSGEMKEGGFEDQQWLVQRDGQFVQLTELLYRVLEQANGQRTLEEMADGVSKATGKTVSADNIEQLVVTKLIPKGLVLKADGTVDQAAAAGQAATRSPLQLTMRTKVISPRLVEPITTILQFFYFPPVIIGILLVSVLAQGWVYFIHGIAGSLHNLFYAPGLILVMLVLTIVSTAFHELGHASALRYGGGKIRSLGVGIYLIYPAFYADVTDNYRLGRWARVRTDLGGFYFNLIFALGMIIAYFITRQEFLLVFVVLMDIEIIHQCLPFVRLDGYWALADMTGIPDFFSQMGPFLRSVLPIPGWKGRELPNLKGWVNIVFVLYILITIPLLALLLFFTVKGTPRILATAWDSFLKQGGTFSHALARGDALGVIGAGLQIVLLALPTFGLLLVLYNVGRRVLTAIWKWSKPTPARRMAGAFGTLVLATGLVFLWAPQLPFVKHVPGPFYRQTNFQPIAANERGSIPDAVKGVVATRTPADNLLPRLSPKQTPSPSATGTPGTTNNSNSNGTPAPQQNAPTPAPTVAPAVATPVPAPTATPAAAAPGLNPASAPAVAPANLQPTGPTATPVP